MLLNPLTLHTPKSVQEAAKLYKELEDSRVLAGGTFLMNSLKLFKHKGTKTPRNVLSLSKVADLKGIIFDGKTLTIKAMTTITEIFENPIIEEHFPVLKIIARNISTTPIRNMASFGGNLTCRYTWTEMPVAMIALDAQMHFLSADGTPSVVSAEDFFKNNARSEALFTHVVITKDSNAKLAYRRVRKMSDVDQPLLTLSVKASIKNKKWSNVRVVINSGTAFAQRDYTLETFLEGKDSKESLGLEAMNHLTTAIYDTRSTEYKQHMFRISIQRSVEELCKSN